MRISDWSSDVCSSDLVANARIEGNSLIDVARITLAAGADAERSAPPVDSKFERNLIVGAKGHDPFRAEGEIGGIAFADNVQEIGRASGRARVGQDVLVPVVGVSLKKKKRTKKI